MKKLILALFFLFGGIAFAQAQSKSQTPSAAVKTENHTHQQIELRTLPQAVKTAMESKDYQGWIASSAHRSTQADKNDETKIVEVYVVEMKNGANTKSIKFDKEGNKLEGGKDDQ